MPSHGGITGFTTRRVMYNCESLQYFIHFLDIESSNKPANVA